MASRMRAFQALSSALCGVLGQQAVHQGEGVGVLPGVDELLELRERGRGRGRGRASRRGQRPEIESVADDRGLAHLRRDERLEVGDVSRGVADVQAVAHEDQLAVEDGLNELARERGLVRSLRDRLQADLVSLHDEDAQRDDAAAHAAADGHGRSGAADPESDRGEGNDHHVAGAHRFPDHVCRGQLRHQLVELSERSGEGSLGPEATQGSASRAATNEGLSIQTSRPSWFAPTTVRTSSPISSKTSCTPTGAISGMRTAR